MNSSCMDAARRYLAAGLSFLPVKSDGSKRPALSTWAAHQQQLPTEADIARWFRGPCGLALIGGAVSGNLEILDLDVPGLDAEFEQFAEDNGRLELIQKLAKSRTPSGGVHYYYRLSAEPEGNRKLARLAGGEVKIETRGEGGYAIVPPSPPECHPDRKAYVLERGDLAGLPVLTQEEHRDLLRLARALNDYAEQAQPVSAAAVASPRRILQSGLKPGEDYNERGELLQLLERHGWKRDHQDGQEIHFTRPGKSRGTSATYRTGCFYVFTSSAPPFEPDQGYSPFAVFTLLEHSGDFSAAASALYKEGYGDRTETKFPGPGNFNISGDSDLENAPFQTQENQKTLAVSEMNPEQWEHRLRFLVHQKKESDEWYRWEIGRLWAAEHIPYGLKMKVGEDLFGKALSTVNNWATTWRNFPDEEARGPLRFAHCAELNGQAPAVVNRYKDRLTDQKERARKGEKVDFLSANQIRIELKTKRKPKGWMAVVQMLPKQLGKEIEEAIERDGGIEIARRIRDALGRPKRVTASQFRDDFANDAALIEEARTHVLEFEGDEPEEGFLFVEPDLPPETPAEATEVHIEDSNDITPSNSVIYDCQSGIDHSPDLRLISTAPIPSDSTPDLYPDQPTEAVVMAPAAPPEEHAEIKAAIREALQHGGLTPAEQVVKSIGREFGRSEIEIVNIIAELREAGRVRCRDNDRGQGCYQWLFQRQAVGSA